MIYNQKTMKQKKPKTRKIKSPKDRGEIEKKDFINLLKKVVKKK